MKNNQQGFTMIEVLISVIIILVGILGIAGLNLRANQSEYESYQKAQALVLLSDISQRILSNQNAISCYTDYDTTNFVGVGSSISATDTCTHTTTPFSSTRVVSDIQASTAVADMLAWDNALKGAAVTQGTGASLENLGAMRSARGCISYDATMNAVLVEVAWASRSRLNLPTTGLTCGLNAFGDNQLRRVVSKWIRIPSL